MNSSLAFVLNDHLHQNRFLNLPVKPIAGLLRGILQEAEKGPTHFRMYRNVRQRLQARVTMVESLASSSMKRSVFVELNVANPLQPTLTRGHLVIGILRNVGLHKIALRGLATLWRGEPRNKASANCACRCGRISWTPMSFVKMGIAGDGHVRTDSS